MNITNEMINEIRNKIDIVDIISNYLPLTQKGKNYFGVCPFHDDHSPSMSVSKEKQIFTCFSCGKTGNVFTFVADYEHIGFYDAVKVLGAKVGYNLGAIKKHVNKNQEAYDMYSLACKYYQNSLFTNMGNNAREYLEKRQIDKETIKKFKIGLSTSNMSLTDFLINKKIPLKKIIDYGIANESGKDIFINRIMFPLCDLEGNVVAFSGRIYSTKDNSKYVNTKETPIFKKGNILYNYHNAKELLKKNETIIVMEGFMDVIRASTVGINNCVATMGTALTKQNASLLKKMSDNIILCFDGDAAGEEATIHAINVLKEIDVTPKVIRLEDNLDPDEYILKNGKADFMAKVNSPMNSIEFLMKIHKNNKNLTDIEDISTYIDEALKDLSSIDDEVMIELTLNKLSKEFSISYNTLLDKYQKIKPEKKILIKEKTKNTEIKLNQYDQASRYLINYMFKDDKIISTVEKRITFFPDNQIRILANEIIDYYHKYKTINEADFISYIANNESDLNLLNQIIQINKKDFTEEEIEDYIKVINSYPIKRKIAKLNQELKEETNPIKQANILSEILSLKGVK